MHIIGGRMVPRGVAVALSVCAIAACGSGGSSKAQPPSNQPGFGGSDLRMSSQPATTTMAPGSQTPAPVESNPPGDIPDNVAYVPYTNSIGRYTFAHPEGWAAKVNGPAVTFSDKLNGIAATAATTSHPATVDTANAEVARLAATQPAFELRRVKSIVIPGGSGVLIVFRRNSAADPVTGKVFRDEVNRYEIYRSGRLVTLDLYGAVGSDNVDPYTKISQSLRLL